MEVEAPLQDVFQYWSNFMQNVEEVRIAGQDTSHWRV